MMKFFVLLRTLISYICIILAGLLFITPCFFIVLLPAKYRYDNKLFYWLSFAFFKSVLIFSFLPIEIKGKENLPKDEPVIFAGNHQSSLDIAVMGFLCYGYPHIWMVLDFYKDIFILGLFVRRMNISVNQKVPSKAAESLIKAVNLIKNKDRNLIIFPEGRRVRVGRVSSFMKGFAVISRLTKRPIIPVFMPNNYKIYPPRSFLIHYYPLKVVIGPKFYYKDTDTDQSFMERVHNWFIEQNNN